MTKLNPYGIKKIKKMDADTHPHALTHKLRRSLPVIRAGLSHSISPLCSLMSLADIRRRIWRSLNSHSIDSSKYTVPTSLCQKKTTHSSKTLHIKAALASPGCCLSFFFMNHAAHSQTNAIKQPKWEQSRFAKSHVMLDNIQCDVTSHPSAPAYQFNNASTLKHKQPSINEVMFVPYPDYTTIPLSSASSLLGLL